MVICATHESLALHTEVLRRVKHEGQQRMPYPVDSKVLKEVLRWHVPQLGHAGKRACCGDRAAVLCVKLDLGLHAPCEPARVTSWYLQQPCNVPATSAAANVRKPHTVTDERNKPRSS